MHNTPHITIKPKQCLQQAGWFCCRSNKGEVCEGGDWSRGGCEGIGWNNSSALMSSLPPSALSCPPIHPLTSHPSLACRHLSIRRTRRRARKTRRRDISRFCLSSSLTPDCTVPRLISAATQRGCECSGDKQRIILYPCFNYALMRATIMQ